MTDLINLQKAPNKIRKKVKLERKKIRQKYIKVIIRKKYLENTEGLNVRWTENKPELYEGEVMESFGELGNLIYKPQN